MANCPKCKQQWLWDWGQDILRKPEGPGVLMVSRNTPKETDQDCQTTLFICECGCVLAVDVDDEAGETIYNHPEWGGTDWEMAGHCYERSES